MSTGDGFAHIYHPDDSDPVPRCDNDYAADAVRVAACHALGAAYPRRFPGCVDCDNGRW